MNKLALAKMILTVVDSITLEAGGASRREEKRVKKTGIHFKDALKVPIFNEVEITVDLRLLKKHLRSADFVMSNYASQNDFYEVIESNSSSVELLNSELSGARLARNEARLTSLRELYTKEFYEILQDTKKEFDRLSSGRRLNGFMNEPDTKALELVFEDSRYLNLPSSLSKVRSSALSRADKFDYKMKKMQRHCTVLLPYFKRGKIEAHYAEKLILSVLNHLLETDRSSVLQSFGFSDSDIRTFLFLTKKSQNYEKNEKFKEFENFSPAFSIPNDFMLGVCEIRNPIYEGLGATSNAVALVYKDYFFRSGKPFASDKRPKTVEYERTVQKEEAADNNAVLVQKAMYNMANHLSDPTVLDLVSKLAEYSYRREKTLQSEYHKPTRRSHI